MSKWDEVLRLQAQVLAEGQRELLAGHMEPLSVFVLTRQRGRSSVGGEEVEGRLVVRVAPPVLDEDILRSVAEEDPHGALRAAAGDIVRLAEAVGGGEAFGSGLSGFCRACGLDRKDLMDRILRARVAKLRPEAVLVLMEAWMSAGDGPARPAEDPAASEVLLCSAEMRGRRRLACVPILRAERGKGIPSGFGEERELDEAFGRFVSYFDQGQERAVH